MQTLGREVAVKTLVAVLSGVIIATLVAIWGAIKLLAPSLADYYQLSFREASGWAIVVALAAVVIVLSAYVASLQRRRPSTLALTVNSSAKPSVTLTNHGDPINYRVDGRIVGLVDGGPNPQPAPFRCELQVGGIKGAWDAILGDREWANIILGSLEPVLPPGSPGMTVTESWTPTGTRLVIRRGKIGQHVQVPDTGAIVELTVRPTPLLAEPTSPRQFRIVKNGSTATVTEL